MGGLGPKPNTLDGSDETRDQETSRQSHSKTDWLPRLGLAGVLMFVVGSAGVWLWPRTSSSSAIGTSEQERQDSPPAQSTVTLTKLDKGTLRRLASALPSAPDDLVPNPLDDTQTFLTNVRKGPSARDSSNASSKSPYGGPAVAPPSVRPSPTPPPKRLDLPVVRTGRRIFSDIDDRAYASYETLIAISDEQSAEYDEQLVKTLSFCRDAYQWSQRRGDSGRAAELRYLLAYLSMKAGHVIEAAVYGESAARWGDPAESTTRSAASIALAAAQTASEMHWADATQVGELSMMETIADLIDAKWPDDPQRDDIWMELADRYARFDRFAKATKIYESWTPESPRYAEAQRRLGMMTWRQFLTRASQPDPPTQPLVNLLKRTSKYLGTAASQMSAKSKRPTRELVDIQFTRARVFERLGNAKSLRQVLRSGKFSLVNSISTESKAKKDQIVVPVPFIRMVVEMNYRNQLVLGDRRGAQRTLKQLRELVGSDGDVSVQSAAVASAVQTAKSLLRGKTIQADDVETLAQAVGSLLEEDSSLSMTDRTWFARAWAACATLGASRDVTRQCFDEAANLLRSAMDDQEFPPESRPSTLRTLSRWYQQSGQLNEALETARHALELAPTSLDLQTDAVRLLEEMALAEDSVDYLRQAIEGTTSDSDDPPVKVWGWSKLAVTTHQLKFSDRGTDRHGELLLVAHLHLARCRWLLGRVTSDQSATQRSQQRLDRQIKAAHLAIHDTTPGADRWRTIFDQISRLRLAGMSP
ncbi:MAG: hypothetical protein AAF670_17170 [Planctomycetota bacterium]